MNKLLIVLICFGIGILTAQAQRAGQQRGQGMTPELRAEMMTNMMQERLELSDEQAEKIYKVNLARAKNMEMMAERGQSEARKAEALNKKAEAKQRGKAKKEAAQKNVDEELEVRTQEDFDQEIEKILNPDQRKKWEEVKQQRRPAGQQGGQRPTRGGMNRGGGNL
ncbi:P pilus assembly/Cpx signaling pathway, periplasmic inhibitor/zinc-resistance associated protein [Belliella baltica DSM 15883]|uniref:P pilus assembly/Cpx signaling pathway, periplasmic inhibitor/zinc-resistance associated protein n=1 Tax=Belliella baltica (strain DSM 15883 / CIP 108006 / LMG 21964 / BA134) TaxID=866536 RepID=I3Z3C8_BELBD|nr:DUF4890 domain-containing protein [Belliella baltica]AFL83746.1 P pilus assembly/Cpx signaling pathway, periplasmic inhibitor/zinc-resistance associated protein [Belliella baltica DSM 15883]